MTKPEMYFSIDIETDGLLASRYNMVSIGAIVAGTYDGEEFLPVSPSLSQTFFSEIRPVTDLWEEDALRVSAPIGMTASMYRQHLLDKAPDATVVMNEFVAWIKRCCEDGKFTPIGVARPAAFDWPFIQNYTELYADEGSPFSYSKFLCINQLSMDTFGTTLSTSGKRSIGAEFLSKRPHTHNALDDAWEQGESFALIKAENLRRLKLAIRADALSMLKS